MILLHSLSVNSFELLYSISKISLNIETLCPPVLEAGPITFLQLKTLCLQKWQVGIQLLSNRLLSSSFFFSCVGTMARPANL